MKRLVVMALLLAPVVAHAQAAEASRTVIPLSDAQTSLQAELLERLEARLENLETELAACRASTQAVVQPAATNLPAPAQAYVPATRVGGGFRVAPEQKLTCDDYSASYFARHPVMAKVCGVELEMPAQPDAQPEDTPDVTPQADSQTAPHAQ